MSESKFNPDLIRLGDVNVCKGAIDSPFGFKANEDTRFMADISFDMGLNLEDNLVKCDLDIHVESSEVNDKLVKGSFTLEFIYEVENLNDLARLEKDYVDVDDALSLSLASISYSTARGILLTRFQGTGLQQFILPIVKPQNILDSGKEDKA